MQHIKDVLAALLELDPEAPFTITVRAADLLGAMRLHSGGPEVMTCEQAAELHGWTPDRWRKWAKAGYVEGAFQDSAGGPWRLPKLGVEAHVRRQQRRGKSSPPAPRQETSITLHPTGVPRGPRKKQSQKQSPKVA